MALPGDRFVIRSYSPMVTIGGGTLLDIAPPRFKRKAPALLAHSTLLAEGAPGRGRRGARSPRRWRRGAGRRRCRAGCRSAPSACARLLGASAGGRPRRRRSTATGSCTPRALGAAARAGGRRPSSSSTGRSRCAPACRARSCAAGPARPTSASSPTLLGGPRGARGSCGPTGTRCVSASHEVRLSPEQQQAVDRLEQEFLTAAAAPPSPEEALARAGVSRRRGARALPGAGRGPASSSG